MTPKKALENIVEKGEIAGLPVFSPFTTMFSPLSRTNFIILNFSCSNALNVDQSKTFVFGNEINEYTSFSRCMVDLDYQEV